MPRFVRYTTEHQDDVASVALHGELDMAATFKVEQELDRLLDRERVRRLVLDLRPLSFIDSTGLRLLLQTEARAREGEVELAVIRGTAPIQRVFSIAGLTDFFPFVDESPPVPAGAVHREG